MKTDRSTNRSTTKNKKAEYEAAIAKAFNHTQTKPSTRPSTTNHPISERAQKWKEFALVIADSYDKIKLELTNAINHNADLHAQNQLLNTKILTYKDIFRQCDSHNKSMMLAIEKETARSNAYAIECETLKKELSDLKSKYNADAKVKVGLYKTIDKLKKESKVQDMIEPQTIDFYKRVADEQIKGCQSLAEQLICLRSDMDNSNLQSIRARKDVPTPFSERSLSKGEATERCSTEFRMKNVKTPPNYPYVDKYHSNSINTQLKQG